MRREDMPERSRHGGLRLEQRGDGPKTIVGYAAVFYREDDPGTEYELWEGARERILPGAFDGALSRGDDVMAVVNHAVDGLPLGRSTSGTLRLSVDETGLRYEIQPSTQRGYLETLESIERGDLNGSSFKFMPDSVTWRMEGDDEIREIGSVNPLADVGPVWHPAYAATTAGARGIGDIDEVRAERDRWANQQRDAQRRRQVAMRGIWLDTVPLIR